jgi:hypothetical protein
MFYVTMDLCAHDPAGELQRVRRLVRAPVAGPVFAQAVIESVLAGCQEEARAGQPPEHAVRWWLHRADEPDAAVSGLWRPGEPTVVARALYAVL